jgi:hypothetical protein
MVRSKSTSCLTSLLSVSLGIMEDSQDPGKVIHRTGRINYRKVYRTYIGLGDQLTVAYPTESLGGVRPSYRSARDQVTVDNLDEPEIYPQLSESVDRDQLAVEKSQDLMSFFDPATLD